MCYSVSNEQHRGNAEEVTTGMRQRSLEEQSANERGKAASIWAKMMLMALATVVIGCGAMAVKAEKASAATTESLKLLSVGKQYIGVPYQFGAPSGATYAFDCSSFAQHVFGKMGIWLPRTSAAQAWIGKPVAKAYLSVGDLVFFRSGGPGVGHVGIYAGGGNMLHASRSKGITLTSMHTSYWTANYVTARRVL